MKHDRQSWRSRWRLPRTLGVAALTAGVLAAGLPGTALASQAAPARQAAPASTSYTLFLTTSVKAIGHTWTVTLSDLGGSVTVGMSTANKGVLETHEWTTSSAFTPTGVKDLKVTSTGHATFSTAKQLSPVIGVSLAFTPTKATKGSCSKGSEISYSGKVSGSLTLATGLHGGVKVSVKFPAKQVGVLTASKSCVAKSVNQCTGSNWSLSGPNSLAPFVFATQLLGSKAAWPVAIGQFGLKTASKLVTRTIGVQVTGHAPTLNTAAKTISVSGLSAGVTGAAVMTYSFSFTMPTRTCFVGSKKYTATGTTYISSSIKTSKTFQGQSLLAGTVTLKSALTGSYTVVKLTA